jgi:hypothetical protein
MSLTTGWRIADRAIRLSCDVDGDASADFQILCTGAITFTADDFLALSASMRA